MENIKKSELKWVSELKRRSGAQFQLNPNRRWDVDGDVDLSNYGLCKIPIPLGNVKGRLILTNNCYSSLCENFPRNSSGQFGITFEECDFEGNGYLNKDEIKCDLSLLETLSKDYLDTLKYF
jgi:hypothetical protein